MKSESIVNHEQLATLAAHRQGRDLPLLSYGTVRDFCESMDFLPGLATMNRDIKDQQRCWMLKAILDAVPRGGKLLEIGAGEPIVADLLGRLGYSVSVVDPYQGAGNGPTDLEQFRVAYPNVEFVVDLFTTELQGLSHGSFDCCYSISVVEHIPTEFYSNIASAITLFNKPGGRSIHAIDCITAGAGEQYHTDLVQKFLTEINLGYLDLWSVLKAAEKDPDTYFLSAEAHNLWRGAQPYDDFPMRRCISVQIAS